MGICAVGIDEANHAHHREGLLQLRDEYLERRGAEIKEELLESSLSEVTEMVLGESDQLPEILEALFKAKDTDEVIDAVRLLKDEIEEWAASMAEIRANKEIKD